MIHLCQYAKTMEKTNKVVTKRSFLTRLVLERRKIVMFLSFCVNKFDYAFANCLTTCSVTNYWFGIKESRAAFPGIFFLGGGRAERNLRRSLSRETCHCNYLKSSF
ncbi:hypothetical protein CDAR_587691 [Caerostris darwini]|uniref:Uncharacterized protein n=1 Tax=Caerostris darwini TaxID=1538125 RepID=A0AAV4SQD6_9ARAC|nr:hypothetical protein CDAR_587691 [Caerostris darwini]